MRRAICSVALLVMMTVVVPPAAAELTSHADPVGDYEAPDITRITLDNRENNVVGRIRYADISLADFREEFVIRWEGVRGYVVVGADWDEDGDINRHFRLYWYVPGGSGRVKCPAGIHEYRDTEKDVTRIKVPRSCLDKAPDSIQAKAVSYEEDAACSCKKDVTELTDFVDPG